MLSALMQLAVLPILAAAAPASTTTLTATCLRLPIIGGQRGGGDYRNFEQPEANASACRTACCAESSCAFWGLDVRLPAPSRGNCTQHRPCCWLKSAKASRVNPPCAWGCYTGASGRAPPSPPTPSPPPPFKCDSDEHCALAGTCNITTGICQCFPGFLPPDCGVLDIKPAPTSNGWQPSNHTTWGGSPIRVGDTYHLYASLNRWGSVDTWPNSSVIVHATSTEAGGHYHNHTIILGNRSEDFFDGSAVQNPVAIVLHDGSIALFYVGLSCRAPYTSSDCEDSANSSLGVAHAPGPDGPWSRMNKSILASLRPINEEGDALANPAVWQEDDGTLLLAFRGRHDEVLPLATAPHWSGPWTRLFPAGASAFPSGCAPQFCNGSICHNDKSLLTGDDVRDISRPQVGLFKCLEDPFIFRLKSGSYHMLMHNQVGNLAGAHGFSRDGRNWSLSPTPAYTKTVHFEDGSAKRLNRREEPKLLVQQGGEHGRRATHLFNAACFNVEPHVCGQVLAVPLEPIELWAGAD
eukprot:COSAG05_NODE_869_length_6866_cov_20.524457_2_plen_522_part_00